MNARRGGRSIVIGLVLGVLLGPAGALAVVEAPGFLAPVAVVGATVDFSLAAAMRDAAPGDDLDIIVYLRDQLDPRSVTGPDRTARLRALVLALQRVAGTSQRQLRAVLAEGRAAGTVASFTPMWIVDAVAVRAKPAVIAALAARPEVARIEPDAAIATVPHELAASTAAAEPNLQLVNAPAVWDLGDQGQGVVVASLDSGVDATHPDLAATYRGGTDSWYDPYGQHPSTPTDVSGHGTWTMGVIVGGSAGGTAIGVAPAARWIAARVFNDAGQGTTSAIHLAFQWLLDPDANPATADAPNVVNNSWTFSNPGCTLTFQPDLQALVAGGITPVFAAGNFGPNSGTSASPANYPEALAVGAIDNASVIYPASSRGPTTCGGSTGVYPALVAPGVNIWTTDLYGSYLTATGTSLAAPHVTGALALLMSAAPGATVAQLRAAVTG